MSSMPTGISCYVTDQSRIPEPLLSQGPLNNMFAWASSSIAEKQVLHYLYYDDLIDHWQIGMEYGEAVRVNQPQY